MKNKTKFTIITKSLIILFGISTLLTYIISIKFFGASGGQHVYMDFRFGYIFNTTLDKTFIIIFIVGYFLNFGCILNFGYFKKEKISKLRSKLDLVSVVLMLIGLFGYIIYTIEITYPDLSSYDEINYVHTSIEMLDGFYLSIFIIHLVLIEYIILEKTNLLIERYCNKCGETIKNKSQFCNLCGAKQ